jgi:hypothetical protein
MRYRKPASKPFVPEPFKETMVSTMNNSPENDYPQLCFEVGLTCQNCTEGTASQLAAACKGLRAKTVRQLFVQIHTHPACARMHSHFTASYLAASSKPPLAMTAAA